MQRSSGFYSNSTQTWFIDRRGRIWRLGVAARAVVSLPSDASRLHGSIVEERLWRIVGEDPRIAWEAGGRRSTRRDGFRIHALEADAEARFWDLVRDD